MQSVNVRNLDEIQEDDPRRRGIRLGTTFLGSLALAAIVVAGAATIRREGPPTQSVTDPLGDLVQKARRDPELSPERIESKTVTFPSLLSDTDTPTTALAAVKDERGNLVVPGLEAPTALPPPMAADQLPVVPLPAGSLLAATAVTKSPKDDLSELAVRVAEPSMTLAPEGSVGGYQIQVASFQAEADASALVEQLRRRGHRSHTESAYVPNRGLWYRVRIGPFQTKLEAETAKRDFESKEKMAGYLVDPDKVKRQEEVRAAKIQAREDKKKKK